MKLRHVLLLPAALTLGLSGQAFVATSGAATGGFGTCITQVSSDPENPAIGDMWINTTDHTLNWADAGGVAKVASMFTAWNTTSDNLITSQNIRYLGAFRVPNGTIGCSSDACAFSYGGGPIAFNKDGNGGSGSLFMGGHQTGGLTAEITIPSVVNSSNINDLNTASALQGFVDIAEGNRKNILADGGTVFGDEVYNGGFMMWGNKLIGSVYTVFDNGNNGGNQYLSHYTSGLNLSTNGDFSGMFKLSNVAARLVGGYMCKIPASQQAAFGGTALTGQSGLSIIWNSSSGPAVSVFDPSQLGVTDPVPATPLVYYPENHPLAPTSTQNGIFNLTSQVTGIVFPEGYDSVLFFGRHGVGAYCYGDGTSDQSLHGLPTGEGSNIYCYDPVIDSKGPHAYPYKYQAWAYSASDLLSVKNGTKQPWEIAPYSVWNFELPFNDGKGEIMGVAYDNLSGKIYVSQRNGDLAVEYSKNPVVHVFQIDGP
jgi:hypothetical protein